MLAVIPRHSIVAAAAAAHRMSFTSIGMLWTPFVRYYLSAKRLCWTCVATASARPQQAGLDSVMSVRRDAVVPALLRLRWATALAVSESFLWCSPGSQKDTRARA